MKIYSIVGLILLGILTGPVAAMAQTTAIPDTYWGGTPIGSNQDLIGGNGWAISRMEVTETANTVQVKIIGPWFSGDVVGDPRTPGYLGGLFYNSGDLYISSSGWHPDQTNGSPNYSQDTFKQSEGWDFVVTDRKPVTPGLFGYVSGVYALNYDPSLDQWDRLHMTDPTYATSEGRADQAYYGGYGAKIEDATVTFGGTGDDSFILYQFDKFLSGDVGFHWTMYCGNDVIEGQATLVPEPGALLLLGFGLAGLGLYKRRWLESRV